MSAYFADTAYYVALLSPRDALHAGAVRISNGYAGEIVTTEFVLFEVANFLANPPDRQLVTRLWVLLRNDPQTTIVPLSQTLLAAGQERYAERPDKAWSLTDCISFVVMEEQGMTEALTGDRHFSQAGFRALLAID